MNLWMALLLLALGSTQAEGVLDADAAAEPSESAASTDPVMVEESALEVAWPEGDEDAGYELYAESCRACHSGVIAPSLKGAFGRSVAGIEGYAYSAGLAARSGEQWTEANLHAFLSDPSAFAEGSKMQKKVVDPQERADIIAFLKALPE